MKYTTILIYSYSFPYVNKKLKKEIKQVKLILYIKITNLMV